MTLFDSTTSMLRVVVLVVPETSMMSLASTLDPMRAANRIASQKVFDWKISTLDGRDALLSCGITVQPDIAFNEACEGDLLIIVAGFNQYSLVTRKDLKTINLVRRKFTAIAGIEAGSWILARCGLLDNKSATTHWEDLEDFQNQFPKVKLKPDRFVVDGMVFTTGGASPTFDFMLHLIRMRYGYPLAIEVSSAFIYDGVHQSSDTQSQVSLGWLETAEPRVASAIRIMEQHIEEPMLVRDIADQVAISVRMLEYLFLQIMKVSPAAYYRRLRLQMARRLVVDTHLQLQVIAIRAGFNSLSAFSRMFRHYYQQSPAQCRRMHRENRMNQSHPENIVRNLQDVHVTSSGSAR
ncbi:MAG: transcriptional regulator GlxA family with amidase domain [Gammaproteobacteria bacterium]|jgi:transcriptional regulator GlxA family with amidase domain